MTKETTTKAFLIDPFAFEIDSFGKPEVHDDIVREVEIPRANLHAIYATLSHPTHPVDTIDAVRLPAGDVIYVDDEGLFKETSKHWFRIKGFPHPIRGRGLVLGTDSEGNDIAPTITLDALRAAIEAGTDWFGMSAAIKRRAKSGKPMLRQPAIPYLRPAHQQWAKDAGLL